MSSRRSSDTVDTMSANDVELTMSDDAKLVIAGRPRTRRKRITEMDSSC